MNTALAIQQLEKRMSALDPWDEEPSERELVAKPEPAKMENPEDIKRFLLAGAARLTLVSKRSGERFTYRITTPPPNADGTKSPVSHFVSVLTAPDNDRGYSYMGHIFRYADYTHGKPEKVKVSSDATSAKAWMYFWEWVIFKGVRPGEIPKGALEVYHEGRCAACGKTLTDLESISRGIGPECYGRSA